MTIFIAMTPFNVIVAFLKDRHTHGLTQDELAKKIGISKPALLHYLKSDGVKQPRVDNYMLCLHFYEQWRAGSRPSTKRKPRKAPKAVIEARRRKAHRAAVAARQVAKK